ncbi:hypothetical protein EGW08_018595 [Elysia chlorotica]|uniref:Uncharacterized protein n=1 Tax=Elysia chlorotica TaxID=188477 RepID=A0A433SWF6_ELYCH|nr:hypothetical protein EGW08_018595 [Elysia chlorotica]
MSTVEPVPVVPNFEAPAGNWIARNLRLANEDSKELFPQSRRGPSRDKYHSLYKVDFHDYPTDCFIEGLKEKGKEPKRQTIRDVLFGNSPTEVFQGWKIPNRLVPEQIPDGRNEAALAAVYSGKRDRPGLERAATLPAIPSSRERSLNRGSLTPRASPQPVPLARSKTVLDRASVTTKDCLRDSLQPHAVTLAGDWLKTAPKADRKVIERVLRMQEKKHQLDHALKKSLQPDARKSVEDWLESANDSERQVALKFFSSLAGAKLMGSTVEEQKGRLQQVLRTLEGARGGVAGPSVHRSLDFPITQESRLKYVQLLDPHTRANRWMHTTWHHLPEYRNDNPVNNWSSHYVKPHAPTPRHFVIHPDWG